ncbi:hypothetical protein QLX08_001299 [Tetragonisca angustula]|uniref:Uncharacterized protein n=1 Tax=Tetragonisca angustula TaxID=166442 RepID=A0AAW1AG13_9HYME
MAGRRNEQSVRKDDRWCRYPKLGSSRINYAADRNSEMEESPVADRLVPSRSIWMHFVRFPLIEGRWKRAERNRNWPRRWNEMCCWVQARVGLATSCSWCALFPGVS